MDGDPDGHFAIDGATGELSVTSPVDFEAMDAGQDGVFRLTVKVKDKGTPALSTNATVVVAVEDQNDVSPEFESMMYTAVIAEDTAAGEGRGLCFIHIA